MNNNLIFFCIASAILLFSVISINLAPVINGLVGRGLYETNGDPIELSWSDVSCSSFTAAIKDVEDFASEWKYTQERKDKEIKANKHGRKRCNKKKAMANLEYAVFNLNLILGFICAFLGFLQYLEIKKIDIIGFIGLGSGVVGFALTLAYVIESGLVFTDYVDNGQARIDSDSAILKWDESKKNYVCIFYDEKDENSCTIRYSDYGNKYLNYKKQISFPYREKNWELKGCTLNSLFSGTSNMSINYLNCKFLDENTVASSKMKYYDDKLNEKGECDKIYYYEKTSDNIKKNLYNHWLTTLIFSCFILLLNIGLAVFGFLLFNTSGQTKY